MVDFLSPSTLADALAARAERPDAVPLMGGTDVMVDLNFDRHRPGALLDLTRVADLAAWDRVDGWIRLGAGVTYSRLVRDLSTDLPGLATAARTVGSPQIRNRGTVGGNLGSASPAGDCHPALLACGAEIELSSITGVRRVAADAFFLAPGKHAGRPDELVTAVWLTPATGPQTFSKVGTRNAMVIAVTSFALALHPDHRSAGTGIGSAGPVPLRATDAEELLAGGLDWVGLGPVPADLAAKFGRLVAAAASPIDDVRGTAAYRRHALAVMARRSLEWTWRDLTAPEQGGAA